MAIASPTSSACLGLLAALTAIPVATAAQASSRTNRHEGFWIGFGIGGGGMNEFISDSSSYSPPRESHNGLGFSLHLGGTITPKFLLGVEMGGVSSWKGRRGRGLGNLMVVGIWYPDTTKGWYLKGGSGWMFFRSDDGTTVREASSGGFSVGAGYDFRVSRNMSVAPYFDAMLGWPTFVTSNGVPATPEHFFSYAQLGVGLTWH